MIVFSAATVEQTPYWCSPSMFINYFLMSREFIVPRREKARHYMIKIWFLQFQSLLRTFIFKIFDVYIFLARGNIFFFFFFCLTFIREILRILIFKSLKENRSSLENDDHFFSLFLFFIILALSTYTRRSTTSTCRCICIHEPATRSRVQRRVNAAGTCQCGRISCVGTFLCTISER